MFWRKRKNEEPNDVIGRVEHLDMSRGLEYVERLDLMTPKIEELAKVLYAIKEDVARLHNRLDRMEARPRRLPK